MPREASYEIGRYWGRIVNQQLGRTSNNNPQIVITFLIIGRVDAADPDEGLIECPQYERSVFRVITEKTIDYVREDLTTLEFDGEWEELALTHPNCVDLRGKELAFFCQHGSFKLKDGSTITTEQWSIARAGTLAVTPLDEQGCRELNALFGRPLPKQDLAEKQQEADAEQLKTDVENTKSEPANKSDIPF